MRPLPKHLIAGVLELTCTIQAIPAPTFYETQRAAFFLKYLTDLNLSDVQIDPVGNVLARLPGRDRARPLVVSAHMDTVHPVETPLAIQRLDDKIIGPGIGDNALGQAALVGLIRLLRMRNVQLPGDLWLAFNVGEEGLGDLRGIQAVTDRFGDNPLAYLVVEGLGLGTILHRGLGVERYRVTVRTPGGHSWVNFGQPSAIHELCTIVAKIAGLPIPQTPDTSWNVGTFHGGTSVNTIASEAWMELDVRSEDNPTLQNLLENIRAVANTVNRPGVQIDFERIGKRLAGQISANHPLVNLARDVLAEIGIEPRFAIASTDANLPLSRGIPAICIGITQGNKAHTKEEFIQTGPIQQGIQQLFGLVTCAWQELI